MKDCSCEGYKRCVYHQNEVDAAMAAWLTRAPENRALLVRGLRNEGETGERAADLLELIGVSR